MSNSFHKMKVIHISLLLRFPKISALVSRLTLLIHRQQLECPSLASIRTSRLPRIIGSRMSVLPQISNFKIK